MMILFLVENANLRGGTEILTFNLLSSLRAVNIDAWILSLVPYEGDNPFVLSLDNEEYYYWKEISSTKMNKLSFSVKADAVLRKFLTDRLDSLKPTLFVCHTYDIITALPYRRNVAQVFNWSVRGYEDSLMKIIHEKGILYRVVIGFIEHVKRARRHKVLSRIPKLILLTDSAKDEIKTLNSHVKDEQMLVIPDLLMVDEDSLIHSKLNNNNVSFVGRLSHEKGVMRLLRIWEQVSLKLPDLTLSIYGEGGAREEMEKYIKEKCINNVCFKGYCNDLERIYPNSDLLLMTSDTEGFGMVLIEAMYYGVPCISFDCPISPKEIISDAGVLIPSFDEDEYAKAIISLVSSKKQMKALQNNAVMRARDFYKNKIISKWLKIIRD